MATNNFAVSTGSNSFSSSNSAYCSEYMVALGVVFPVYTNRNGGAKWHGRKDQGEHEGTGERENPGEKRRERKPGKEFCFVLVRAMVQVEAVNANKRAGNQELRGQNEQLCLQRDRCS